MSTSRKLALALFALALALPGSAGAQTASPLPPAKQQFLDNSGVPLAGGTVTTYVPSTTTPKTTWVDPNQSVANPTTITLDSAGRAIIFGNGQYRQIVKDALSNTIWDSVTGALAQSPWTGNVDSGGFSLLVPNGVGISSSTAGNDPLLSFLDAGGAATCQPQVQNGTTLSGLGVAGSGAAGCSLNFTAFSLFGTTTASGRGVIPAVLFNSGTSDNTLTNTGSAEAAIVTGGSATNSFQSGANSAFFFDLVYYVTNTGTNSHTWGVSVGPGTAALGGTAVCFAYTATSNALTAVSAIYSTNITSNLVVTAASTSATENVTIACHGRLNVTTAGLVKGFIKPSVATGGTAKVLAGSYFRVWPIGANTVTTVGPWN